jgi:hypothetical protein
MNLADRLRLQRAQATAALAEVLLYARLDFTDMSRRDCERWATVTTWPELGDAVIDWLHGRITQTPGHGGPPCDETIPLIPALEAANLSGFVTNESQQAGWKDRSDAEWEAYVGGFAPAEVLRRIRYLVEETPLLLTACRGRVTRITRPGGVGAQARAWPISGPTRARPLLIFFTTPGMS